MTEQHLGELAAIGTALLWTLSTLAWTAAGKHIGVVSAGFLRLVVAVVLLMAYGQIVRGLALPTDASPRIWLVLGLSGLMGFCLSDLCLFKAFMLIGPRLSLLILSLVPPMAALISWLFLADALSARHWWAMAVTLAGISWVLLEQPESDRQPHERRQLRSGVVLAVMAAAGQAVGLVLARDGIGSYDAAAATLVRIFGAMAGFLVLLTLFRRWGRVMLATRHGPAMLILLLGSLVGPCAGVVLCMIALRHCQAGVVSTIIATMPVLILPFAIFIHREKVSLRAAAGAMLSLAGVALLVC
ncbi:MAG: DMT family transporter [Thermoguttaceae bacterium]